MDGTLSPSHAPRETRVARAGRLVLFVHLALAPVFFSVHTLETFEFPKALLLQVVAALLGVLLVMDWLTRPTWCRPDLITCGVLLILASATVSTVFSIAPHVSWRGAPDSHLGLQTILALSILFFAARRFCTTWNQAGQLLSAVPIAAALVCAHAFLQMFRADGIDWSQATDFASFTRPMGLLGHPNFLAAYLVLAYPPCRMLTRSGSVPRMLAGHVLTVAIVAIVIASLSRAAWFALAVVITLDMANSQFRAGRALRTLLPALALVAACSAVVGTLCLATPQGRSLARGLVERLEHLDQASTRRCIWRGAVHIFEADPITGCGLDTFTLAFPRYRTPRYWDLEWNHTPSKAHNEILHVLATQGLLGAAGLAVLLMGIVLALRRAWHIAPAEHRPLPRTLALGLVGFFLPALLGFTVIGFAGLAVIFVALVSSLSATPLVAGSGSVWAETLLASALILSVFAINLVHASVGFVVLSAILLVVCLVLWPWTIPLDVTHATLVRPSFPAWLAGAALLLALCLWGVRDVVPSIRASLLARAAEQSFSQNPESALDLLDQALRMDPDNDLLWSKLGFAAKTLAPARPARNVALLQRSRRCYEQALRLVPIHPYYHAHLARTFTELARAGENCAGEAFAHYDSALVLDPANACFLADAAHAALVLGDFDRAERWALKCEDLYPRFALPKAQLGYLAQLRHDDVAACRHLEAALQAEWHDDENSMLTAMAALTDSLAREGRWLDAVRFGREALRHRPDWIKPRLAVAYSLECLRDIDHAVDEYRELLARHPELRAVQTELDRLLRN